MIWLTRGHCTSAYRLGRCCEGATLVVAPERSPGGPFGPGGGSPLAGVRGQSPRSLNGTPQRIICMHKQCKFLQNTQYFGVIQTSPI